MTEPVVVTGGTGELGRQVVRRLVSAGREVRLVSRRPRPAADHEPYGWATADLMSGDGLRDALAGAGTVVHCAGRHRPGEDVAAARTLLAAAQATAVGHLVSISIVGIDRIPFGYYRGKVEIERAIAGSGVPYTILRTTQFHELLRTILALAARAPVMPVPDLRFQPIDAGAVAARLVELAGSPPEGRVADLGGPETHALTDLARAYLTRTGRRRPILPLRLPGAAVAAFRRGEHLAPDHPTDGPTFVDHLAAVADPRSTRYGGGR
ncbi:SDR family oxidoreductase [Microlunatus speluncae]|uniref:SDR family oxidoreductase n=1 Tax=Microlunatus speluncae TaxID=2594267 RepID=UPI001266200B|nr:SDR family oxidoreductase [Microlunatus speluncae]